MRAAAFSQVEVTATGYRYDTMGSSKYGPLIIVSTVDARVRVRRLGFGEGLIVGN